MTASAYRPRVGAEGTFAAARAHGAKAEGRGHFKDMACDEAFSFVGCGCPCLFKSYNEIEASILLD